MIDLCLNYYIEALEAVVCRYTAHIRESDDLIERLNAARDQYNQHHG